MPKWQKLLSEENKKTYKNTIRIMKIKKSTSLKKSFQRDCNSSPELIIFKIKHRSVYSMTARNNKPKSRTEKIGF
jgi:hypothetical protein